MLRPVMYVDGGILRVGMMSQHTQKNQTKAQNSFMTSMILMSCQHRECQFSSIFIKEIRKWCSMGR